MTLLDVFNFTRQWSAQLWTLICLVGTGYAFLLWRRTHGARSKLSLVFAEVREGPVRRKLRQFERLAIVVVAWLFVLAIDGVVSMLEPFAHIRPGMMSTGALIRGEFIILTVTLTPVVLIYILHAAFKSYEG